MKTKKTVLGIQALAFSFALLLNYNVVCGQGKGGENGGGGGQIAQPTFFEDNFDDGIISGIYKPILGSGLDESNGVLSVTPRFSTGGVSIRSPLSIPPFGSQDTIAETSYTFKIFPFFTSPSDQLTITTLGEDDKIIDVRKYDNSDNSVLVMEGDRFGNVSVRKIFEFVPNDTITPQFKPKCKFFPLGWDFGRCEYYIIPPIIKWDLGRAFSPVDPTLSNLGVTSIEITSNKPFVISRFEMNISPNQSVHPLQDMTLSREFIQVGGSGSQNQVFLSGPGARFDLFGNIDIKVGGTSVSNIVVVDPSTISFEAPSLPKGSADIVFTGQKNPTGINTDTLFDVSWQNSLYYFATSSPLVMNRNSLPLANMTIPYSTQIVASGGSGTLNFSMASGKLPHGLVLNSNGAINGTPLEMGVFGFYVLVTDGTGEQDIKVFFIEVKKRPDARFAHSIDDENLLVSTFANPISENTNISVFVPSGYRNIEIAICNLLGSTLKKYELHEGDNTIQLYPTEFSNGVYLFMLKVNGALIENKKIIMLNK